VKKSGAYLDSRHWLSWRSQAFLSVRKSLKI